jgi:hypothetical protein
VSFFFSNLPRRAGPPCVSERRNDHLLAGRVCSRIPFAAGDSEKVSEKSGAFSLSPESEPEKSNRPTNNLGDRLAASIGFQEAAGGVNAIIVRSAPLTKASTWSAHSASADLTSRSYELRL